MPLRPLLFAAAVLLSASSASAEQAMTFKASGVPGWKVHTTGGAQFFYMCTAPYCGAGSTVSVSIHKEVPKALAEGQEAIRQDAISANQGAVKDVIFAPIKTATDHGLQASSQEYHLSLRPSTVPLDLPATKYGFLANPEAPLTVSIVSSAQSTALAAKNFGIFAREALGPLSKGIQK